MNKKMRVLLIAGILVVTVGFVAYGMLTLFVDPYISVDAVVEDPEAYMGRSIQVKGTLQPGSISINAENVTLVLDGETHSITVLVEGELPNLTDGQDMVAIGFLESGALIRASRILAQCPSKYETATTTT
ncbi:MAG: cytochrome c maturation protein CcmE [Candidatus Hermodarchaeota archaeon]